MRARTAEALLALAWALAGVLAVSLLGVLVYGATGAALGSMELWQVLFFGLLQAAGWVVLALAVAVPLGVGTAVYLAEVCDRRPGAQMLLRVLRNLAGVPAVAVGGAVWLGLAALPQVPTAVGAVAALSWIGVPAMILCTDRALLEVPAAQRRAARALGASRMETIRAVVLPQARPRLVRGTLDLAARLLGAAAPLLVVGASSALPASLVTWVQSGDPTLRAQAAAGALLLLAAVGGLGEAARRWPLEVA